MEPKSQRFVKGPSLWSMEETKSQWMVEGPSQWSIGGYESHNCKGDEAMNWRGAQTWDLGDELTM